VTNFGSITDGLSNTFFLGEKHVRPGEFGVSNCNVGNDRRADSSVYNGDSFCVAKRIAGVNFPLALSPTSSNNFQFGSWHAGGGVNFVFGDGSVRTLNVSTSGSILSRLAVRHDGLTVGNF
jgi:prepilin-type processing-associated H-X9-DG protein